MRAWGNLGIAFALLLAAAVLASCDSANTAGSPEAHERTGELLRKGDFRRHAAGTFANTKDFCELSPSSDFAVEEGMPADAGPTAIARHYASEWPRRLRRAAFEGCRAGLANVPVRFPASATAAQDIWRRNFIAVAVTGEDGDPPVLRPLHIRLSFSEEQEHSIGWEANCNGYGGDVRFTATKMEVTGGGSTLVGCMPEVETEDEWLAGFMEADPEWRLEGQRLQLSAEGSTIELRGFEDPKKCLISPDGGWIEFSKRWVDCERALGFVVLYLEGKRLYHQEWQCGDAKWVGKGLSVICRDGQEWFAVHGFDPSTLGRPLRAADRGRSE